MKLDRLEFSYCNLAKNFQTLSPFIILSHVCEWAIWISLYTTLHSLMGEDFLILFNQAVHFQAFFVKFGNSFSQIFNFMKGNII